MKYKNLMFNHDIYLNKLNIIEGIKFTFKELEVIGWLLNGRSTKTIASFLSISPKTVLTHIHNIMLKLECNSREQIINFIERSQQFSQIREYHTSLRAHLAFEQKLKSLTPLKTKLIESVKIVLCTNDKNLSFLPYLEKHLAYAGLKVSTCISESYGNLLCCMRELQDTTDTTLSLCVLPSIEMEHFHTAHALKEKMPENMLFLLIDDERELSEEKDFPTIKVSQCENYYALMFEILKNVYPIETLEKTVLEFIKKPETLIKEKDLSSLECLSENKDRTLSIQEQNHHVVATQTRDGKKVLYLFLIGLFACIEYMKISDKYEIIRNGVSSAHLQQSHNLYVRSDMSVPVDSVLLKRLDILEKIEKAFENSKEIQVVALVGIGGAGKTTIARCYARQHSLEVVWEINAETSTSLKDSFEKLAQSLAESEKSKKVLQSVQNIQDIQERESKIIEFVNRHLKERHRWLLIFDNVGKFSDIRKYCPLDTKAWGNGKVLLTTRNDTIRNNVISKIIRVGELTQEEKIILFENIINSGEGVIPLDLQRESLKRFLKAIPPFPLDVSIAAYTLKTTDLSYESYLQNLQDQTKDFKDLQENLLKEAGTYTKTRFNITAFSLSKVIAENKDFEELLLTVSLIGSQHIPNELLENYKPKAVVANFLYNLKKYSLITTGRKSYRSQESNFSLHRSTQSIMKEYMLEKLQREVIEKMITHISKALEKCMAEGKDKRNYEKMQHLREHCEKFLENSKPFLDDEEQASLMKQLGEAYYYLGDFKRAKAILIQGYGLFSKTHPEGCEKMARTLVQLGEVYKEIGAYEQSCEVFEKGLALYKKDPPRNPMDVAEALMFLGNTYRSMEQYEKAKKLLEKSLFIYYKYLPKSSPTLAWPLQLLGYIYEDLGDYKKAKELYKRSLNICYRHLNKNHVDLAWSSANVGVAYMRLGEHEKAKPYLAQGYRVLKLNLSENHVHMAWMLRHLGELYIHQGLPLKAKIIFEKSLAIAKTHLPENHNRVILISLWLGEVYRQLKEPTKAKKLIEKNLKFLQESKLQNSLLIGFALLKLGNVCKDLGEYPQAESYLQKSLQIYKRHYGDSHIETAEVLQSLTQLYALKSNGTGVIPYFKKALYIFTENHHPKARVLQETRE